MEIKKDFLDGKASVSISAEGTVLKSTQSIDLSIANEYVDKIIRETDNKIDDLVWANAKPWVEKAYAEGIQKAFEAAQKKLND